MMHSAATRSLPKKAPEYLASHKLDDWKYEDEWRLLYSVENFYNDINAVPPEMWGQGKSIEFVRPSRIIIGMSMPDATEKMLRNLSQHLGIVVSKVTKNEAGIKIL